MFGFGKRETYVLKIEGMSCEHCRARVEKALCALHGVKATVDLAKAEATVEAPASVSPERLRRAIEEAGYHVV